MGLTHEETKNCPTGLATRGRWSWGVSPNEDKRSALINTPLQWGADGGEEFDNRFNGFPSAEQTVETVQCPHRSSGTPLKWGVNEMSSNRPHSEMRRRSYREA